MRKPDTSKFGVSARMVYETRNQGFDRAYANMTERQEAREASQVRDMKNANRGKASNATLGGLKFPGEKLMTFGGNCQPCTKCGEAGDTITDNGWRCWPCRREEVHA